MTSKLETETTRHPDIPPIGSTQHNLRRTFVSQNSVLNLIKTLDLNTSLQEMQGIKGTRNILNLTAGRQPANSKL